MAYRYKNVQTREGRGTGRDLSPYYNHANHNEPVGAVREPPLQWVQHLIFIAEIRAKRKTETLPYPA